MMTQLETRRYAVLKQILHAFEGVMREEGISLHEADVIDDYGSAADRKRARQLDTDQRWQEVRWADIERYDSIFCFLDAKGFRYYLPAYMVWSLYHYASSNSLSVDFTIYALSPSPGNLREYCMEKYRLIPMAQSEAICCFLRFMAEETGGMVDEDAAWSALQYWGNQQTC